MRYTVVQDEGTWYVYDNTRKDILGFVWARTKDGAQALADVRNACEAIVGLTEEDASKVLAEWDYTLRVSCRDGKGQTLTCDHNPSRANVMMCNDLVSSLDYWG